MRKINVLIVLSFILIFVVGCGPTKFVYKSPEIKPPEATGLIMAYRNIEDQRADRKIDGIYENQNPIKDVERIIEEEIMSTGLFKKVFLISGDQVNDQSYLKQNNVDFLMASALKELKWEVPNYESKNAGAFVAGFMGGLVGGLIYSSIRTDVNGNAILKVNVTDVDSGKLSIDKEYVGRCTERRATLNCDTPETKATVVGNSVKSIMDQFKEDLVEAVKVRTEKTGK